MEMFPGFESTQVGFGKYCRTCKHRQPTECGSKTIQYCGIRTSNRTDNGKLKIKCKTGACRFYEE